MACVLKKHTQRRKDPPCLSLMQVIYLSPSHWSGKGAHSSQLANLRQIVAGRRGKDGGGCHRKAFQLKLEQNGVTKISFDRKDIMLTLYNFPFNFLSNVLFFKFLSMVLALIFYCAHQEYIFLVEGGSQLLC